MYVYIDIEYMPLNWRKLYFSHYKICFVINLNVSEKNLDFEAEIKVRFVSTLSSTVSTLLEDYR